MFSNQGRSAYPRSWMKTFNGFRPTDLVQMSEHPGFGTNLGYLAPRTVCVCGNFYTAGSALHYLHLDVQDKFFLG